MINNPRIRRYEDIIGRLKRMLGGEKKSLRLVRTLCAREIEAKNQLEKVLRACVDDVKNEIARKRAENKSIYRKTHYILNICVDKGRRGGEGGG
jgi:superfamily I DNA and/or RNA helicase